MVDFTIVIGVSFIVISFLALFIFIKKLDNEETFHQQYQGKNRMVSLSARKLPFEGISLSENRDALKLSVKANSSFSLTYSCYVAANELRNALLNKKNNGKTLLETVKVLSLWTSDLKSFTLTEDDNNISTDQFNLKDIPEDIAEQLKILKEKDKKDFCPFTAHLETESIDGLTDNDIVSMLAVFSTSSSQPEEYYMETLSGSIYPIKKLYAAGVQEDENLTQSSTQLCVVCQNNPVTRVTLPCRHASVCKSCYHKLEDFCPICRERITSYFPIMDESFLPATEEESRDNITADIRRMGWWEFVKSVWNAN